MEQRWPSPAIRVFDDAMIYHETSYNADHSQPRGLHLKSGSHLPLPRNRNRQAGVRTTSDGSPRRLLSGIRVLDFGRVLAAPHCALLLGSLGAEVIKIERPLHGDDSRANGYLYPQGISGYFMQQNWGKKSVSVDLKRPEAIGVVKRLVSHSDVVIENFRPGTMEKLGLGWEALHRINPRLIMCSISAFGQTGPDARRPGYGALAEGRAGIPTMTGEPDGPPMPTSIPIADALAASHAFGAICAALYSRTRTGTGEYIDIALLDCAVEMHDWGIQQFLSSGGALRPTRRGMFDRSIVPWGYFQAGDGWICLIVSNDAFWRKLARLMGRPELGDNPDYSTVEARARNNIEVYRVVSDWIASYPDADRLLAVLQAADLPADRLQTIDEVVQDPQLRARHMFLEADHPVLGKLKVMNTALRFRESESGLSGLPPQLGQHNQQVLKSLGYTEAELEDLYRTGALYREPRADDQISSEPFRKAELEENGELGG
jgi:crotonobetainyl-CoA:carnitine CoA-transferase CaiB-like acyl-CoA transferase